MYTRICPTCLNIIEHKTPQSGKRMEGKECFSCAQKNPEKARRVSIANKGKEYNKSKLGYIESDETRAKKSLALKGRVPGFGGKKHKKTTRLKMSKRRSEMLRDRFGHGQISPWYNKDACKLFDEINAELGWNGHHAENGGEFYVGGYWVDYYEPVHNVVIEFDEPRHDIPSISEKDLIREDNIKQLLGCNFIRIKQGFEYEWKHLLQEYIV